MKWQTGLPKMATGVFEKPKSITPHLIPSSCSATWCFQWLLCSFPSWHRTKFILLTSKCGLWIKTICSKFWGCQCDFSCSLKKTPQGKEQSRLRRDLKCTTRGLGLVKSMDCQYEICAGDKMSTLDTLLDSSSLLRLYSSSTQ